MGVVLEDKVLNQAVQAYGSEAAAVSKTVAVGLGALHDPRGINAVADAYEGYFPQVENRNKATLSGLSTEGAFPSPSEFLQNAIPSDEVSRPFNDPTFNAAKELPSFLKNVFGKGGIPNAFAEAGIVIVNSLGGPDTKEGVAIKLPQEGEKGIIVQRPGDVGSEKGFVIYGKSDESSSKGFIWFRPDETLDQSLQRLQTLGPSSPEGESEIIIHAFVQKLQNLMKLQSILQNQQSMGQDLALPVFSNLRV